MYWRNRKCHFVINFFRKVILYKIKCILSIVTSKKKKKLLYQLSNLMGIRSRSYNDLFQKNKMGFSRMNFLSWRFLIFFILFFYKKIDFRINFWNIFSVLLNDDSKVSNPALYIKLISIHFLCMKKGTLWWINKYLNGSAKLDWGVIIIGFIIQKSSISRNEKMFSILKRCTRIQKHLKNYSENSTLIRYIFLTTGY